MTVQLAAVLRVVRATAVDRLSAFPRVPACSWSAAGSKPDKLSTRHALSNVVD